MRVLMQGNAVCLIYGRGMQEDGEGRELRSIQDSSPDETR